MSTIYPNDIMLVSKQQNAASIEMMHEAAAMLTSYLPLRQLRGIYKDGTDVACIWERMPNQADCERIQKTFDLVSLHEDLEVGNVTVDVPYKRSDIGGLLKLRAAHGLGWDVAKADPRG